MAWPSKKVTMDDLDDGFKSKLEAGEAAKKAAEEVKTGLTTFQTSTQTQFDEIKESLKGITGKLNTAPVTTTTKTDDTTTTDDTTSAPNWGEDADAAFVDRFNKRAAPLMRGVVSSHVQLSLGALRDRVGPLYDTMKDEILKEIDMRPINFYTNYPQDRGGLNGAVEAIYNEVRGRHIDEIINDREKKQGKYFVESGSRSSGSGRTTGVESIDDGNKPQTTLNEDELKLIARLGLSKEEYLKGANKMRSYQNDEVKYI